MLIAIGAMLVAYVWQRTIRSAFVAGMLGALWLWMGVVYQILTTIFTLGLLAWTTKPVPWAVLVIPLSWTVVGTSAAITLGMIEDFALIPAALLLVFARVRPGRIAHGHA